MNVYNKNNDKKHEREVDWLFHKKTPIENLALFPHWEHKIMCQHSLPSPLFSGQCAMTQCLHFINKKQTKDLGNKRDW